MRHIEGVPLGTRLDGIRSAEPNEHYIGIAGEVVLWNQKYRSNCVWPVIKPDNVYNVLDLSTVAIPEGYKRVAYDWFREPRFQEIYRSINNIHVVTNSGQLSDSDKRRVILEPIKPRTLRVLIAEWDLTDGENLDSTPLVNLSTGRTARAWRTRIEERPV